jgi:prepilin-type N-terminal cleavage/methylation domain-containing protein
MTRQTRLAKTSGLTLIEMLVAITLLGFVGVALTGFLTPFKISQDSSQESVATAYGRTYIETLKAKWTDKAVFDAKTMLTKSTDDPKPASPEIELSDGWDVSVNSGDWTTTGTLRTVKVTVTAPNSKTFLLSTQISR